MALKSVGTTYMVCRVESGWWFTQEDAEEEDDEDVEDAGEEDDEEEFTEGEDDMEDMDMLLAKRLRAIEATGSDVDKTDAEGGVV